MHFPSGFAEKVHVHHKISKFQNCLKFKLSSYYNFDFLVIVRVDFRIYFLPDANIPGEGRTFTLSRFSTWPFFSREQAKSECDWLVMSSVFVPSQSSCFFLCSREQIRLVKNRL